ncbi:TetR/AcrR family transcriptional regulator [Streptomyces sp. NPDC102283]|uniref:TetR/AcrR family transcriptional regulator n=1 Tax=Streptomyces sp. NPDC102283 TaxID=3366155 RepID=UPI0037FA683B
MTEKPATRRRAAGMSPEQRREMIVRSAIPLIAEYGAGVTTAKVARAAGIGEATIFRVFADKEELLDACMAEAMRHDHAVRELMSIPADLPTVDRLAEAADALEAHLDRMGAIAGSLHASGHRRRDTPAGEQARGMGREESMSAIRSAVAELLAPDSASLRLPVEQAAALFLGLLFTRPHPDDPSRLTGGQLADVFLHGALAATRGADR